MEVSYLMSLRYLNGFDTPQRSCTWKDSQEHLQNDQHTQITAKHNTHQSRPAHHTGSQPQALKQPGQPLALCPPRRKLRL